MYIRENNKKGELRRIITRARRALPTFLLAVLPFHQAIADDVRVTHFL